MTPLDTEGSQIRAFQARFGSDECPQGAAWLCKQPGAVGGAPARPGGGWAGRLDKWCAFSLWRKGERAGCLRAAQPGGVASSGWARPAA